MKYLSLFSGIGGFEKAIEQAYENNQTVRTNEEQKDTLKGGNKSLFASKRNRKDRNEYPTCIGYSEIDKYATKIYEAHYPNHKPYGDITAIVTSQLPDFDLLVGGFPCQSFSIAGKRGGFNDTRGTLFFEIARILRDKRPRYLVLENVKGLLSHDSGKTFSTILGVLSDIGYDCQWQVLNSKNFGVPQNRERVFIVGHLRGIPERKVFPLGNTDKVNNEQSEKLSEQVSNTLRTNYGGGYSNETYVLGRNESYALDANYHKGTNTLDDGRRQMVLDGRIRRLTPVECARLQGFPDDWHKIEGISDTQAYKCYGNAVTVNVVEEVIKRLFDYLQ